MQVKTDFTGFLNSDAAPQKLQPTEYINLENFRIGETTDKGRTLQLETIGANVEIPNAYLPAGTNICIGSCEDEARQRIIYFVWNSNGDHAIYSCDSSNLYKVLINSQLVDGFTFDKYKLIHSARVIGDLLVWPDGAGDTKCINIEAGIKLNHPSYDTDQAAYATPVKYTTTTLIKRPPIYAVTWVKATDGTNVNNFIQNKSYQFTYSYRYRDSQVSALSSFSQIVPPNKAKDTFNRIDITFPFAETIDDDVYAIDLWFRYGNTGKTFLVKSWDKDSDAAAIADHNSATTALSYSFFDDTRGQSLDNVAANTNFDNVPLSSGALEVAGNRIFLGNNKFGYNTPSKSSLSVTVSNFDTGGAGTYASKFKYMNLKYYDVSNPSVLLDKKVYYVYSATINPAAYYFSALKDGGSPTSLNASDADVSWDTEKNLAYYIIRNNTGLPSNQRWSFSPEPTYVDSSDVSLIVSSDAAVPDFFKSNSSYKISIAFYDRFRRKCGIIKNAQSVTIPARKYNQSVFSSTINWILDNTDALNEIPDWAYYYQIHITKNQTTNFFLQGNSIKNTYVTKAADGTLTYNKTTWADNTNYATAFDLTQFIANGQGYTYADGDLLVVYKTDSTYVVIPVIGRDGANVLCKPTDIGDLTTDTSNVIELYTPYTPSTTEIFYETGAVFNIINPGTDERTYSVLSGQINGDCYAIERSKAPSDFYFVEAMSPNDSVWKVWDTDTGWPNAVVAKGQKQIYGSIAFSDTFTEGSDVNGINKFQELNVVTVPSQNGAVNKLRLTSKTQAEGQVMLAICEFETMSIYLGEAVLTSATGENTAIATSNGVIGTMNTLKGSRGTINPESVVAYRGNVYWFDARSGDFVFYSVNGLHSLTAGKATRFAKQFADAYKSLTAVEIEALGNRPFVIGGIDPRHKEVLWSIPKTGDNPNGTISDTDANIPYPYDFWDAQGKTILLKLSGDSEAVMGSHIYNADSFCIIGSDLYSFNNGKIYLHNQTSAYNTFYGTAVKAKVMFAVNAEPSMPKVLGGIVVESNVCPDYAHFRTEYPYVQSSDLVVGDFLVKEGIFYAAALRDRLSPNAAGDANAKLRSGDRLRGTYIYQMLEFDKTDGVVQLKASNTAFIDSRGQKV